MCFQPFHCMHILSPLFYLLILVVLWELFKFQLTDHETSSSNILHYNQMKSREYHHPVSNLRLIFRFTQKCLNFCKWPSVRKVLFFYFLFFSHWFNAWLWRKASLDQNIKSLKEKQRKKQNKTTLAGEKKNSYVL